MILRRRRNISPAAPFRSLPDHVDKGGSLSISLKLVDKTTKSIANATMRTRISWRTVWINEKFLVVSKLEFVLGVL